MANRINQADLEAVVERINHATKQPLTSYITKDGQHLPQKGNYHLDYAYGGVALHQMCDDKSGAIRDIFHGHYKKSELYERMHSLLKGMEIANGD